jgi:biotin operon repressor
MDEQEISLSSTAAFLCASLAEGSRVLGVDPVSTLIILSAMQETDARPRSASALSRQLGLARETARRRVQDLRKAGFLAPPSSDEDGLELIERAEIAALSVMLADLAIQHARTFDGGRPVVDGPAQDTSF